MTCPCCRGAGNQVTVTAGRIEWWVCAPCGGAGVRVQYGPAVLQRTHEPRR